MNIIQDAKTDFVPCVKKALQNYVNFNGRATRPEYWWFWLFAVLGSIVLGMISGMLQSLFSLAIVLPWFAVGARRLHDIGKSGWWQLLVLIPVIGVLILLYFFAQASETGENRFGPAPIQQ